MSRNAEIAQLASTLLEELEAAAEIEWSDDIREQLADVTNRARLACSLALIEAATDEAVRCLHQLHDDAREAIVLSHHTTRRRRGDQTEESP